MKSPRYPPMFATVSVSPYDTNSCCLRIANYLRAESKDSQFKSPRHHEDDHLGVFWEVPIWTLRVVVRPWCGKEVLQSQLGEVARGVLDLGQSHLQQLIH